MNPLYLSVSITIIAFIGAVICRLVKHALARDSMNKNLAYIRENLKPFGLRVSVDKSKYVISDSKRTTRRMNAYDTEKLLERMGEHRDHVLDCFRINSNVIYKPVDFMKKGDQ